MQTLDPMQTPAKSPAKSYNMDDWRSGYRSQPEEFDYWIDDIDGEIPADLTGTYFRNGPGLLDINGHPVKHPFDGDGMVSAIAFQDRQAYYRNRFVRTQGYVAEQQAGKPLYRGVFGTQRPGGPFANAFDLQLKNIANTNILFWGDKLLALWEAAEPHRLDPRTLETLGLDHLDGLLKAGDPFSAHPRIDPTGERTGGQPCLVNFAVKTGLSSTISIYEFDPKGRLVHQQKRSIPGFAFLHDFAITPNYCIFFQNPVSFNPFPFLMGLKGAAECIALNPKQSTRAILMPRDGKSEMQTLEIPPCFVFHHANAFEQDGKVMVDSVCYSDFPSLDGGEYAEVDFDQVPAGKLWRFTLDPANGTSESHPLINRCCEFPVLHPNHVGRPYRYLYIGTAHQSSGNAPLQALLKYDLETGTETVYSVAPRGFAGEPIFVPRPQGQAEDDGWVLLQTYNAATRKSELHILTAQDLAPVATLKLKHHIPYGLHGSFVPQYFGPPISHVAHSD
ncbi:MAG: carotenoid oxygenase family protein [Cyanobacteria bacterium P01_A01_bin.105]